MGFSKSHTVKKGDSLYSIAKKYDTNITSIKKMNNLNSNTIRINDRLLVSVDDYSKLGFKWPITWKGVTSKWGYRIDPVSGKRRLKHTGIDLRAGMNTPVYAPKEGVVRIAGWLKGYGKTIIIDHKGGYSTRLAHLNSIGVKAGDQVKIGESIARSGQTGRVTGPHLHYEVRYNERPLNPILFRG